MSGHGGGRGRGGAEHEEHEEGGERWLLSYADFITLLLALFMVLFALSTIDRNKFAEFRTGLVSAFDSSANASPTVPGGTGLLDESSLVKAAGTSKELKEVKPGPVSDNNAGAAKAAVKIKATLKSKGLLGDVAIQQTSRGLVIRLLTDKVFFDTGSADLAAQGAAVIDTVGNALKGLPNQIAVEGHTDNRPINSAQYPTNWELSSNRADTVLRRLTEHAGVDPAHLQATGYADTRPLVPNDTDADRARNRRVEIIVLNDAPTAATAATAAAASSSTTGSTSTTSSNSTATGSTNAAGSAAPTGGN